MIRLLQYLAYRFGGGPWRNLWCKLGYDPRTTPLSRMYSIFPPLHACVASLTFPLHHHYRVCACVFAWFSYQIIDFRVPPERISDLKLVETRPLLGSFPSLLPVAKIPCPRFLFPMLSCLVPLGNGDQRAPFQPRKPRVVAPKGSSFALSEVSMKRNSPNKKQNRTKKNYKVQSCACTFPFQILHCTALHTL